MHTYAKLIVLLLFIFGVFHVLQAQKLNPQYDSLLAKKYGADSYGNKNYFFVLLKTGPTMIDDKSKVNKLFEGHMANIVRLAKEEKLIVAGPFGKNEMYRGLFILNTAKLEEAREMLSGDPAIQEGILEAIYIPWYGSAALPAYLESSWKMGKYSF